MSQLVRPGFEEGEVVSLFASAKEPSLVSGPHISGISIDGFGALCGIELAELGPGLTVLSGPNEAGKSTLFDFISTMLFGFPARKADDRYHSPVRGGRHGGRLTLTEQQGEDWVIERFSQPKKIFSLRRPDGSLAEDGELRRLLGGATEELFRAVFAVNLDDLRQLDGMSSDEVREVLFSSSILGQRRSTARALAELEATCDGLVRPRQGALANALAEELRTTKTELAEARRRAGGFAALETERADLSRRAAELQEAQEAARGRLRDVELLEKAWEVTSGLRSLQEELALLGSASPEEEALLARAGRFQSLRSDLSGHLERLEAYREDRQRREKLVTSVAERAGELGGPEAVALAQSPGFEPELLRNEFDALRSALDRAEGRSATVRDRLAQEKRAAEALGQPAVDRQLPSAREIDERLEVLNQLRAWSTEKDLLGRQLEQRQLEARARAPEPGFARGLLLVAGLLAAGLAALGGIIAWKGEPAYGLLVLAMAAVMVALSLAAARRSGSPTRSDDGVSEETGTELKQRYEQASGELARLSAEAGLSLPVSPVALQGRLAETERLREERRALDEEESRAEMAARRLAEEEVLLCRAQDELDAARRRIDDFGARIGCRNASVDELADRLSRLEKLKDRLGALERLDGELERVGRAISSYEERLCSLVAEFSEPAPAAIDGPLAAEAVRQLLEELDGRLQQAEGRSSRRARLRAELAGGEAEIDRLLGLGEKAEELRKQLAAGRVLDWRAEMAAAKGAVASLQGERDEVVRREEVLARELGSLAASADVPSLEQRCLELEERLDEALEGYLVASGARLLLHETLRRYEKERQPAVLALASEHFARVTEGRYVRLGVDSAPDGTKPVIRAFSADGASVDAGSLSRGAMEQLYLSLRLGLAESFAERYLPLPLVLDDVLVNSDPGRRAQMARELALTAERHQVLFLTCHPEVAELLQDVSSSAQVVELSRL